MHIKDIPKFEKLNTLNINVFELQSNVLRPVYINDHYQDKQIDLLLYKNHCLITHIQRLISNKKNSHMQWVCRRCLTCFSNTITLNSHIDRCIHQNPIKISFSNKDCIQFEKFFMKIPIPIKIYADFECINNRINNQISDKSQILFEQKPIAVGYYFIFNQYSEYFSYFGTDCVEWFTNRMFEIEKFAIMYFNQYIALKMSEKDEEHFQNCEVCWLCDKKCKKMKK